MYEIYVYIPYRMCPHFVVVVGLERFNELLGYAVEILTPDRSKVRFQTKRDTVVCTVRGDRGSLPGRVCSSDVTVQVIQ